MPVKTIMNEDIPRRAIVSAEAVVDDRDGDKWPAWRVELECGHVWLKGRKPDEAAPTGDDGCTMCAPPEAFTVTG